MGEWWMGQKSGGGSKKSSHTNAFHAGAGQRCGQRKPIQTHSNPFNPFNPFDLFNPFTFHVSRFTFHASRSHFLSSLALFHTIPRMELALNARIFVAGHCGLAGSAIWRELQRRGFTRLIGRTRAELDLLNREAVERFYAQEKPEYVFLAAGKVGGILANDRHPAEFLFENLQIETNVR